MTMDLMESIEFSVETNLRDLDVSITALDSMRRINMSREFVVKNADRIELARDILSRVLDDVGGKHG